ncbi:MAG: Ig-like domain-containing protein [Gammaproteobacteria bacterium]
MSVLRWLVVVTGLMLGASQLAVAGGTYYTDTDNENNAGTGVADNDMDVTVSRGAGIHPIEFNIDVNGPLPTTSAFLTIRANDVDEEQGEIDDVYFNGQFIGYLGGANNVQSTTAFEIPVGLVQSGNNLVQVFVDRNNAGWVVTVYWGQLVIDGGAADRANTTSVEITGYTINAGTITINTSAQIAVAQTATYRVDLNLIDPNGNNSSVITETINATAGDNLTRTYAPTYPLNGGSGTYTIQAQLFYIDTDNGSFPIQQDVETISFEHVQNVGPQLPAAGSTTTISASPTSITADGSSTSTITVQAKDATSTNISSGGDTVVLNTSAGSLGSVTDNGDGTYSATFTAAATAGTATITGTINGNAITDDATVAMVPGAAATGTSTVSTVAASLTADGTSTTTVTVQLIDANGNNLTSGGDTVVISTTSGSVGSVTDNGDGTYSAVLTAATTAGTATVSASVNAAPITDTAQVSFVPGAAAAGTTQITSAAASIVANGISATTITVQVVDANGNSLTSGGDTVVLNSTAGSLGSVTDNGNGTYSATLTSSVTAGTATVTGTVNGNAITDNAIVSFVPGAAAGATSTISTSSTSIVADGVTTATITVQLIDANGNSLASGGDTVVLNTTAGSLGSVTDNGNGTYSATLTSSVTAGTATVTGTVNGNAITDNAVVSFVPGAAAGATSTISTSSASIVADGVTTAAITVQLIDANGNSLTSGGDTVVLNTTAGTLGSVTDNGNGSYSATLTSSVTAGTATVTGTVNSNPITDNAVVSFVPGAAAGATSTISTSSASIVADGVTTATITVQLIDANGNSRPAVATPSY